MEAMNDDGALFADLTLGNQASGQDGLFAYNVAGPQSFRSVGVKGDYSPDDRPFETFYLPLLSRAISYDRAVGYWSAAELQFAAQGTAHFLANGGRMRLIVGAQLSEADVEAVLAGEPLDEVVAARLLADPELEGAQIVAREHLSVLAWMVANDRLEIRVGVPRDGDKLLTYKESGKYFHTKYGIFTDRFSNKVAFIGSNNASVNAWVRNHETFDAYPSWLEQVWEYNGVKKVRDFEKHWNQNPDAGWAVIPLPAAVREHLIHHAPDTPPLSIEEPAKPRQQVELQEGQVDLRAAWNELIALRDAPLDSKFTAVATAWAQPLPHQAELIHRVVDTYPRSYLFADEVGLGKTVEAGMVLREMFLSGKAQKALLLVPASVMKQWQEELHEKMNLDVPRYDKGGFVDRFDRPIAADPSVNPWSAFPIVLGSSHLARRRDRRQQVLDAGPWDIVLVDEAHHARRRGSKPTDTPNSLLSLLQTMQEREMWRALYLVSATPMQMNPHEAWDLIALLGLKGKWGENARFFLGYFERLRLDPGWRDWQFLCEMLGDYFSDPIADRDNNLEAEVRDALGFAGSYAVTNLHQNPPSKEARAQMPNATSDLMDKWLRRHNPMRDRVFRNTRRTMREYQAAGIIPDYVTIPYRHVDDAFIDLSPHERALYNRIEAYIRRHYNAFKSDQNTQALGFIMTVYRRRLTSSFEAIKKSLTRRLEVLEQGKSLGDLLTEDDRYDVENTLFDPEAFDVSADRLRDEIHELRDFLTDLDTITGEDTKAHRLRNDVLDALGGTYDSVVVFTQYTDTMDYVRERLVGAGITKIGCYSGRGGEIYDASAKTWLSVSKTDIKNRFRSSDLDEKLNVLIGTDSMSEGLNLQTSGRLINYDMPWNLMRVEQRIGRVDRIGARYEHLQISNYFYKDTIEQRVYEGIAEDYGDFTEIVGDAAPVLADVEKVIEQLALSDASDAAIRAEVDNIRGEVESLKNRAIQATDLGVAPEVTGQMQEPPALSGETDLDDLRNTLTDNPLTGPLLQLEMGRDNTYRLTLPSAIEVYSFALHAGTTSMKGYTAVHEQPSDILITFDRDTADKHSDDTTLLTYGTPELEALLPARPRED